MSYHIPRTGEEVIWVDSYGELKKVVTTQVADVQAGIIVLPDGTHVRYVDPAGAAEYESMSWHYPSDDASRIGQSKESRSVTVPDYAKSYVRARRK